MMFASSPPNEEESMIQKIKEMQAERFNEVIALIEKESKNKSKEELLNELILKFEENKLRLEAEMNRHLQSMQLNEGNSKKEQHSYSTYIMKEKENYENIDLKAYDSEASSSLNFDYEGMPEDFEEFKIFDQRLKLIREDKARKLDKIDEDLLDRKILSQEATQKKEFIYAKFNKQIKEVEKHKKQFVFSLTQLKKNALKCQKSAMLESSSTSKIRKSFSAGNTVLKSVLQEIRISEFQDDISQHSLREGEHPRGKCSYSREDLPPTNTPIVNLASPESSCKSIAGERLADKINTEAMK
jgi:hypothetical protein